MLDTGGDISEGGDLGELGVWKSIGDIRAGVVMADTYLCEHRIPHVSVVERRSIEQGGAGTKFIKGYSQRTVIIEYLSFTLEVRHPWILSLYSQEFPYRNHAKISSLKLLRV